MAMLALERAEHKNWLPGSATSTGCLCSWSSLCGPAKPACTGWVAGVWHCNITPSTASVPMDYEVCVFACMVKSNTRWKEEEEEEEEEAEEEEEEGG